MYNLAKLRIIARKESMINMIKIEFEVDGMRCGMCEAHINDAVRRVEGVRKVSSSHKKGKTEVIAQDGTNPEMIKQAIEQQGYIVKNTESGSYEKRGLFSRKEK